MTDHTVNVAALIGSRICHDLISPVGAVTNGLELLSMSGVPKSPELNLVSDSAADANARIRMFRLAFGAATADQKTSSDELRSILAGQYSDGRIKIDWQPVGPLPRQLAQAAILAIMCVEQSLPYGGAMRISIDGDRWSIFGTAERIRTRPDLWAGLSGDEAISDISAADIQYLLLRDLLASLNRKASISSPDNSVSISF